ncbi:uncharacterized protein [Hemitrygon akajei]|uniref:uncharacterized protein n=1 Tax=Hemitrygon akajei TaxID=2704970 RepID=UPI003BFA1FB3
MFDDFCLLSVSYQNVVHPVRDIPEPGTRESTKHAGVLLTSTKYPACSPEYRGSNDDSCPLLRHTVLHHRLRVSVGGPATIAHDCLGVLANTAHLVFPGVGLTPLSKQASSDYGRFSFLSSETQRILDRMDDSEIYVNVKFTKTGSETPSRGPHKQEPNENIGNRPDRKIWLLCLVTLILFVTVVGLSIHVSQIPQSMFTSDRNCHEVNSTCQSTISKNSHMDLSQRTCLNNLSALNSNLSNVKRMHSDLRHQFREMETKYRSVNETKAQICELLTSRREQPFSQEWIRNEDGCYFISTFNYSYNEAKQYCLNSDSKLLEISSAQEQIFFSKTIRDQGISYWIGKCKDGKEASNVLGRNNGGDFECGVCGPYTENKPCDEVRTRFVCEKSAALCPDISDKIQDLCEQQVGPT